MSDPTSAKRNWLITDKGDAINLDFLSKVMWGGNFLAPQNTAVFFFHGISQGNGSTIKYTYVDSATAEASYDRVLDTLRTLGIVTDLRDDTAVIESLDVTTGPAGGGTTVNLFGVGFTVPGIVKFDGVVAATTLSSETDVTVVTPAHAAGAVDVTFTDALGRVSTLAASYTYV